MVELDLIFTAGGYVGRERHVAEVRDRNVRCRFHNAVLEAIWRIGVPALRTGGVAPVDQPILHEHPGLPRLDVIRRIDELLPNSTTAMALTCVGGFPDVRIELHGIFVRTENASAATDTFLGFDAADGESSLRPGEQSRRLGDIIVAIAHYLLRIVRSFAVHGMNAWLMLGSAIHLLWDGAGIGRMKAAFLRR